MIIKVKTLFFVKNSMSMETFTSCVFITNLNRSSPQVNLVLRNLSPLFMETPPNQGNEIEHNSTYSHHYTRHNERDIITPGPVIQPTCRIR